MAQIFLNHAYDQWIFRLVNLAMTFSLFVHILLLITYAIDRIWNYNLHYIGEHPHHPWTRHYITCILILYTTSCFSSFALSESRVSTDQRFYWILIGLIAPAPFIFLWRRIDVKWRAALFLIQLIILAVIKCSLPLIPIDM